MALKALQANNHKLQITVYHPSLANYLYQLGLPRHYKAIVRKPNQSVEVKALALGGSAYSLDKIINIVERLPKGEVAILWSSMSQRIKPTCWTKFCVPKPTMPCSCLIT